MSAVEVDVLVYGDGKGRDGDGCDWEKRIERKPGMAERRKGMGRNEH
jgi:hypothetical protein